MHLLMKWVLPLLFWSSRMVGGEHHHHGGESCDHHHEPAGHDGLHAAERHSRDETDEHSHNIIEAHSKRHSVGHEAEIITARRMDHRGGYTVHHDHGDHTHGAHSHGNPSVELHQPPRPDRTDGITDLMAAILKNQIKTATKIISDGVELNAQNEKGNKINVKLLYYIYLLV